MIVILLKVNNQENAGTFPEKREGNKFIIINPKITNWDKKDD